MTAPPKKKYQAKSSSVEEESRAKKKAKPRDDEDEDDEKLRAKKKTRDDEDEDDEEDEKPRRKKRSRDDEDEDEEPKSKKKSRDDDEDEDDDEAGDLDRYDTDGKIAKRLDLDPGFKNRALMKQVRGELARGEVVYYACRPSAVIAQKQGYVGMAGGLLFSLIGGGVGAVMLLQGSAKVPTVAVLVPLLFVAIGILMAILAPIMKNRQARLGWYAVTDRRAIVFHVSIWGSSGHATTYTPAEVRNMWVQKSFWLKGGGDVVFKTIVTYTTQTTRSRHGGSHTSTSKSTQHFGFLGVEYAKDVEALIREVLLTRRRDDDDDDEDDDD
jgi:hypothetical protein